MNKKILFGLTLEELEEEFESLPKFRAKQIANQLYKRCAKNFNEMNDLPKNLRAELSKYYEIKNLRLVKQIDSLTGTTKKFLLACKNGDIIETVLMNHNYGNTACISSQVGCQMGCKFCASTFKCFKRNLTSAEILGEIFFVVDFLKSKQQTLDSIVVMGIGEPLNNFENLIKALKLLHEDYCLGMSYRKITISTCGIVPMIKKLRDEKIPVTLSISLHAPNNELRSALMPINSVFNLETLINAGKNYFAETGRRVTYEYILIGGINDSEEHARQLTKILAGQSVNVNLIPFNPISEKSFLPPTNHSVQKFYHFLNSHGVNVTIRKEMGADINAACGQLRAKFS